MSSSQSGSGSGSGRQSSISRLSHLLHQDQNPSARDSSDNEDSCGRASRSIHRRQDPSPSRTRSRTPFSSSLNQTAPARSYFQRPVNDSNGISLLRTILVIYIQLTLSSPRRHCPNKFSGGSRRHCRACLVSPIRCCIVASSLSQPDTHLFNTEQYPPA